MLSSLGLTLFDRKILISDKKGCIIHRNMPLAAINRTSCRLVAYGYAAEKLRGRGDICISGFLERGCISNTRCAAAVLTPMLDKASGASFLKPDVFVSVPSSICDTLRRAFYETLKLSGAHRVMLVPSAISAAVGLGMDISESAVLIITVDERITSFSLVHSSCESAGASVYIGYGDFDDALIRYMRKKRKIIISRETAEDIRKSSDTSLTRHGRNTAEDILFQFTIDSEELSLVYKPVIDRFCELFCDFIDTIPQSLITIISGTLITGCESCVSDLDSAITSATNFTTQIIDDCECIARGIGLISNKKLRKELGLTYLFEGIQ